MSGIQQTVNRIRALVSTVNSSWPLVESRHNSWDLASWKEVDRVTANHSLRSTASQGTSNIPIPCFLVLGCNRQARVKTIESGEEAWRQRAESCRCVPENLTAFKSLTWRWHYCSEQPSGTARWNGISFTNRCCPFQSEAPSPIL